MKETRIYALLERIGNLCRSEERRVAGKYRLQPVHLHTLRYLNRANRYSNTPIAIAEYLGITKGTASQTVKALIKHEHVKRKPDANDRRLSRLELTASGRRIVLSLTPPESFKEPIGQLAGKIEEPLESLLRQLQKSGGAQTFGVCKTCHYHENHTGVIHCELTGEKLRQAESEYICREHQPV